MYVYTVLKIFKNKITVSTSANEINEQIMSAFK